MDNKKHYKLYKSGKTWKTVAITIATAAGMLSATTLTGNADTMTTTSTPAENTATVDHSGTSVDDKNTNVTPMTDIEATPAKDVEATPATNVTTEPVKNGQVTENGATYYYDNGQMKTNYFQTAADGSISYYGDDGKMYQDKFYQNWGNTYYFKNDGKLMVNDYYKNWGNTYYFGEEGIRYTNRLQAKDNTVYAYDENGVQYRNRFYYNWGNAYYFGADGKRYTDQFLTQNGHIYYFDNDGVQYKNKMYSNWGNQYYFNNYGELSQNTSVTVNGKSYTADKDGILTEQTKWISPIAGVSLSPSSFAQAQRFGYDGGFRTNGFHDGLDFGSYDHPGSSIRAVAAGKVMQVGYTPGLEWYVTVDTGDYLVVYQEAFASRNNIAVKPGQWLNQGDFIGTRNTSHLHLGVTKQKNFNVALASSFSNNGTWLNPLDFF